MAKKAAPAKKAPAKKAATKKNAEDTKKIALVPLPKRPAKKAKIKKLFEDAEFSKRHNKVNSDFYSDRQTRWNTPEPKEEE